MEAIVSTSNIHCTLPRFPSIRCLLKLSIFLYSTFDSRFTFCCLFSHILFYFWSFTNHVHCRYSWKRRVIVGASNSWLETLFDDLRLFQEYLYIRSTSIISLSGIQNVFWKHCVPSWNTTFLCCLNFCRNYQRAKA